MNSAPDVQAAPPRRERFYLWGAGALALVLLIAIIFYVALALLPDLRTHRDLNAQLVVAQRDLAAAERASAAAPQTLQEQLAKAQAHLDTTAGKFLTDAEAVATLNRAYDYSRAAGVDILNLQTQPDKANALFTVKTYRLQVTGSFDGLLNFLSRVQAATGRGL